MKYKDAFTFIELSIVIVIIALIIAAIAAEKSLIRASQIRSLITQVNEIEIAVNSFQDRYNAIPGDFSNAYNTFGGASVTGCTSTACNGNGNNLIDSNAEQYNFYLHLNLADLIQGNYTGSQYPITKFKRASISPRYVNFNLFNNIIRGRNILQIGYLSDAIAKINTFGGDEMYEIDIKIDDELAYSGKVLGGFDNANGSYSYSSTTSGCPMYDSTNTTTYNIAIKNPTCCMYYLLQNI